MLVSFFFCDVTIWHSFTTTLNDTGKHLEWESCWKEITVVLQKDVDVNKPWSKAQSSQSFKSIHKEKS